MPKCAAMSCQAALALAGLCTAAPAADLPKDGTYDYTVCFIRKTSRIDFSASKFGFSYDETGTAAAKVPGALFDKETVRCVGMISEFDGKRTGSSLCQGVAPNGDRRLTRFWYDDEGRIRREQVSGTGALEKLVTTGSVEPVGPTEALGPDTVKYCHRATGSYRLR